MCCSKLRKANSFVVFPLATNVHGISGMQHTKGGAGERFSLEPSSTCSSFVVAVTSRYSACLSSPPSLRPLSLPLYKRLPPCPPGTLPDRISSSSLLPWMKVRTRGLSPASFTFSPRGDPGGDRASCRSHWSVFKIGEGEGEGGKEGERMSRRMRKREGGGGGRGREEKTRRERGESTR